MNEDYFLAALRGEYLRPEVDSPCAVGERWPVIRTGDRSPINRMTRRLIRERDGGRCVFCQSKTWRLELDHIIPWSAGGPDTADNLRSLCHDCNTNRSNYRTDNDRVALPVTHACDVCITEWTRSFGFSHAGVCLPANQSVTAYCGSCSSVAWVTDPRRLK